MPRLLKDRMIGRFQDSLKTPWRIHGDNMAKLVRLQSTETDVPKLLKDRIETKRKYFCKTA